MKEFINRRIYNEGRGVGIQKATPKKKIKKDNK
jgi:hypothetical protein